MNCHSVNDDQHIHNFYEVSFSAAIAKLALGSFEMGG